MIRISVTSKLDGIHSWSLVAQETCPGSFAADGGLVDACRGCYATQGNYRYPNVRAPRVENREDWQRDGWVSDMVAELARDKYFRWFDSGDVYAIGLARKILEVMRLTPWCRHWLPTRMYKFSKFVPVLNAMHALPNVVVRPSSDAVDGTFTAGVHGSCIVPEGQKTPKGARRCNAPTHDGKCSGCRACWSKSVPVVAYVAHGRSMAKVIMLKKVA